MSETTIYEGPTEKDAVRAACQALLVEPKMLTYTVLEVREPTKTRFRTTRGYCKIEVTGVSRTLPTTPRKNTEEAFTEEPRRDRAPRERQERSSRGARDDRRGGREDSRNGKPRREKREIELDPQMVAQSREKGEGLVSTLLDTMGFGGDYSLQVEENDHRVFIRLETEDALLLDNDAEVIASLQYIANASIHWKLKGKKVVVERAGAKEEREQAIASLARELAAKVVESGQEVTLKPMHAADRRLVHQTLNDFQGVETRSEGAGGFRCVRIVPA